MPATSDFTQPRSSGYCYRQVNQDSEPMTDPRFLSWYNTETASNPYQLPRFPSSRYGDSNEELQEPVDTPTVEKDERPLLAWNVGNTHDVALSSYLPNAQGPYQYAGLHSIEGDNSRWNIPSYSFGYPTPQSDLSLSPAQEAHRGFPSVSLHDNNKRDDLQAASDLIDVQEGFEALATVGREFSHNLTPPSPEGPEFSLRQSRNYRQASDPNESHDDDNFQSEPYAQLILRALKSAPGHRMVLKDIYQWFEKNTNKAKGNSKGWQNSIRHNLSMNGAFKKIDQDLPTDNAKRGFIWVLEASALAGGVKSTTRYRKSGSSKRVAKAGHAAPERQRSGAKGGKAARNAAKVRRSARIDRPRSWYPEDIPLESIETPLTNMGDQPLTPASIWTPDGMESMFGSASRSLTPLSTGQSMYSYGDIAGVTSDIPDGPLFADECENMGADDLMAFHSTFGSDNAVPRSSNHTLQLM
ncbi:MAG: hypothetical protein Q9186_003498 [Xanthomendoza sp. 1 TL-2023]